MEARSSRRADRCSGSPDGRGQGWIHLEGGLPGIVEEAFWAARRDSTEAVAWAEANWEAASRTRAEAVSRWERMRKG